MPLKGFEPTNPGSERQLNHDLDRTAAGIGPRKFMHRKIISSSQPCEPYCRKSSADRKNVFCVPMMFIIRLFFWRGNYFFLILAHPVYKI